MARLAGVRPDHVWGDLQVDQTADGRILKLLHVGDGSPAKHRLSSSAGASDANATVAVLDRLIATMGRAPNTHPLRQRAPTSSPAARGRTPTWSPSAPGSAANCSQPMFSCFWSRLKARPRTTTSTGPTRHSR